MTWGITSEGLSIPTLAEIKTITESELRTLLGSNINLLPSSLFNQIVALESDGKAKIWEAIEGVYNSQYPDTATKKSLVDVGAITAHSPLFATKSRVAGQGLFGTPGTVVNVGDLTLSVTNNPTSRFVNNTAATLGTGTDEVQSLTASDTPTSGSFKLRYTNIFYGQETTGALQYDATAQNIQDALNALLGLSGIIVAGAWPTFSITFANSDGRQPQPLIEAVDVTLQDGGGAVTLQITETTPGQFQATIDMEAEDTGSSFTAPAGYLREIETPLSGIDSTFNPLDAVVGRDDETDAEFRIRRAARLQISIAGPAEAIRTALLKLNDVEGATTLESVIVFENITLITDARELPPKSVRAIVFQAGGATDRDQEIADTIWLRSKCAGIEPDGAVIKTVTDSQGFTHECKFSRPDEILIYLILDLVTTAEYPDDGDDQVKAKMVSWGNALGVGKDVIIYGSNALTSQFDEIPGITDLTVKIGVAPSPTQDDNIPIDDGTGGAVELSRWDTSRIQVNS